MSFFYGLDTEAYDRDYSDRELIQRILGYFVPHRRNVLIVASIITAVAVAYRIHLKEKEQKIEALEQKIQELEEKV